MFGSSNAFGQSSNSSPFGTQNPSAFGQTSNPNSPFGTQTPSAFGQTNNASPFGTQTPSAFGQTNNASSFGTQTPSAFGQSNNASSPFGMQTPSAFGQNNNASSPFAARPFGNSTPFGAQTGSSMFGGTSTGVFGATQASSPFGSTPAFGASGNSSFAFSTPQSSPFGSNTQQSQSAFGNSMFGASSTPAFGASSTPAFGSTNTNPFGASSTPAFGTSSTSSFGVSSSPAFGVTPTSAFGNSGNNAFSSGGAFAASSTPAFGTSTTPSFSFGSSPAFGQSNSAFSSTQSPFGQPNSAFSSTQSPFGQSNSAFSSTQSPFGQSNSAFSSTQSPFGQSNSAFSSTPSPFGAQGAQTSTPFGAQQVGSRVKPYAATPEADQAGSAGKLSSISAMPAYKNKTHEELRWEDYQRGDKGGPSPGGTGFGVTNSQTSLFSTFNQTPANPPSPFSSPTPTNTFTNPFSSTTTTNTFPSPFSSSTAATPFSNPLPSTTTTNTFNSPNLFSNPITTPKFSLPFGQTATAPSMFNSTSSTATSTFTSSSTPGFSSSSSLFNSNLAPGSTSPFTSQSSPLFCSNPFGQPNTSTALGQTSTLFPQNTSPAFSQPNNFSTPSTGFANAFSSSPSFTTNNSPFSQTTPAPLTPYQPAQPVQPPGAFSFNFSQTQPANSTSLGPFSTGNVGQVPAPANTAVMQPTPVTNPFGTLPALPQISIGQSGNSPSIKYGISSMPVVDKPAPVRTSPLLTSRHLLQRRVKLPARKYCPGDDGPKVAFFSDEENSNTPKADALFIPRENPRSLFIRPVEKEKSAPRKDNPTPLQENGKSLNGVTNGANHENKKNSEVRDAPPVKANQKPNGGHEINGGEKNGSNSSPSRAEIESVMPKLQHSEYFTEPRIQELAAKERVNPGYCKQVRDFVVGRHGYGSIKFLGETDVRKLDLETLVQFNNREVIVYMDESQKPPVGEGLNKPAEVTLLNIKCMDKKSGKQVTEGSRLDKYKVMLKRKAEEQGAQFVSYDAVNGEWKFKVEHFSSYMLGDEDDV